MTDPEPIPEVGSQVGHYQFLREIAKGPFGPLYELRAEAGSNGLNGLGRLVTLPADLDPEAEQAISEAAWESLELKHDLLLCVADVVFGKGWFTLIHDHSEGSLLRSLQRRAQERQSAFPVAVALRVVFDVLKGLEKSREACDAAGVTWVPGGVGSTSLYLCGDGRTRGLDGQVMPTLMRSSQMRQSVSSVGFPPPELIESGREPDERSDVFVAGAVLWELLSGKDLSLGGAVAQGQRPRPKVPSLHLSLPKGVAPISPTVVRAVNAALELDPASRPQTRAELRKLLTEGTVIASYEDVINFTDALLHRESTLFRLTMDAGPRLSDQIHGDRPKPAHIEFAIELAKRAAAVEASHTPKPSQAAPKSSLPSPGPKSPAQPAPKSSPIASRAPISPAASKSAEAVSGKATETHAAPAKAAPARAGTAVGGKPLAKQTLMGIGLSSGPVSPTKGGGAAASAAAMAGPAVAGSTSRMTNAGAAVASAAKDEAPTETAPPPKVSTLPKPPPKPSSQPPKPDGLRFEAARFDSGKSDSVRPEPPKREPAKHEPIKTEPAKPEPAHFETSKQPGSKPEKPLEKKTLMGLTPNAPAAIQLPPITSDSTMAGAAAGGRSAETAPPTGSPDKRGAHALLSATIEQQKVEIDRVLASTAAVAAEPAMGHSVHGYPAPARISAYDQATASKSGSVLHLKLSTLIIGAVVAMVLAVGATILVLRGSAKDSKPKGVAVEPSAVPASAKPAEARPPAIPAPASSPEPQAVASASAAPEASAAPAPSPAPVPTEKPPVAVPTTKAAAPAVQAPAPNSVKSVRKRRGNQYIPNEL